MPLLGLIGFPLTHSFSPQYFQSIFLSEGLKNWDYQLFPLPDIHALPELLRTQQELLAFNVTIPHKAAVLSFCQEQSEEVTAIGAANLVLVNRVDQSLKAFNTDVWGFENSLFPWYQGGKRALIIGSGGSSKAVQFVLKNKGIPIDVLSRSKPESSTILHLSHYDLIVNCTPLGMLHHQADPLYPLPYHQINTQHSFFDLVYNPQETAMMKVFAAAGAQTKNGLEMLHLQADRAWQLIKQAL